MINQPILNLIYHLETQFDDISIARKEELSGLAKAIFKSLNSYNCAKITVICTHNSRRSQLGQLWLNVAALYYNVSHISTFSGGTEATAFHLNMINAIKRAGFNILTIEEGNNPKYHINISSEINYDVYYSKKFSENYNPQKQFIAVMVCSEADQGCPFVPGASNRISLPYQDPKNFDGTTSQNEAYDNKVLEIGREMLYTLNLVKSMQK